MNATVNRMLHAYGQVQVTTGVEAATPHKLICMLYDGALLAISHARVHLARGEIAERGAAISKAIAIIDEGLKLSLDEEAGGELAQNLKALYDYLSRRLLEANLKGDAAALDEAERLLRELKTAWETIGAGEAVKPAVQPRDEPPKAAASYGRA